MKEIAELLLALLGIGLVLWFCWRLSRYLSKRTSLIAKTANMRVLERIPLAQDKGLAIVTICDVPYLVAYSSEKVEIVREMNPGELKTEPDDTPPFLKNLAEAVLSRRNGMKTDDTDRYRRDEADRDRPEDLE